MMQRTARAGQPGARLRACMGACLGVAACVVMALPVLAADDPARTTADPSVPTDELELLLLPLDRGELEIEAAAWIGLVKQKVHELSDAEIAAKYKRLEIAKAEEAAAAARAAQEAAEEAEKAQEKLVSGDDIERRQVEEVVEEAEAAAVEAQEAIEEATQVEQRVEEHEGAQEVTEEAIEDAAGETAGKVKAVADEAEIGEGAVRRAEEADAEQLEQVAQAVEEAAEAKAEVREAIFDRVTELRNERTELLTRARLVLDKLEEKGGEVDEPRRYLEAVAGVQVDVTDTTATWATLVGWLKAPQGGVRWLANLGRFVVVVLLAWLLATVLGKLVERAMRLSDRISELTRLFVQRTLRRVILAGGVIAGLAMMEINVGPLLAVLGAAAFVLAFALQDSLGNLAAGIMIMIFRPFDIGDVISAAGARGRVDSMNIVSTTIKTSDNQTVVVPNRKIWGDVITNITGSERRRVDMVFHVGHDADLDRAQEILERIVRDNPLVLEEPAPLVRVAELEESGVSLECRPWARTKDLGQLRSEITRAVKKEFDLAGIPWGATVRIHRVEKESAAPAS